MWPGWRNQLAWSALVWVAATGCRQALGLERADDDLQPPADARDDVASDATFDALKDSPVDTAPPTVAEQIVAAENACARITTCNQGVGAIDLASCVRTMLNVLADRSVHPVGAPLWNCLATVKSCDDVSACSSGATAAGACSGAGGGSAKVCVGGSVVTCSATNNVGAELCAAAGRTCVVLSATSAACVASSDCPTASPSCNGDRFVDCATSLDLGSDCSRLGGVCKMVGGAAGCTGADTSCSSTETTCAATVATYCRFGTEARIDCALTGATCAVGDAGTGCTPAASDCRESDAPSCAGTDVRYCLAGKLRTVSCTALGLGPCANTFSLGGSSVGCAR